jgi:hypothetical protein
MELRGFTFSKTVGIDLFDQAIRNNVNWRHIPPPARSGEFQGNRIQDEQR